MFCPNCGAQVSGNFCARCGTRLAGAANGADPAASWEDEVCYDALLQFPEVRDRVARYAARARNGMSGEGFLKLCDKALTGLAGVPVPLSTVASIIAPLYARMGIRTGKAQEELLPLPPGKAVVAALCSLAQNGQSLKGVHQAADGCVLEAVLPSDIWSFEGELIVSVHRHDRGSRVEAATRVPGQLFDWGKSKRCLARFFANLSSCNE